MHSHPIWYAIFKISILINGKYAVQCQIKYHGFDPAESLIQLAPREGEFTLRTEDILSTIEQHGDSIALVLFSGVQYYTGQFFDIQKITGNVFSKWQCL